MCIENKITDILTRFENSEIKIGLLEDGSLIGTLVLDGYEDFSKIDESIDEVIDKILIEAEKRY